MLRTLTVWWASFFLQQQNGLFQLFLLNLHTKIKTDEEY